MNDINPLKSRKFWLTVIGVAGIISQMLTGAIETQAGVAAITALITGYNIGNGIGKIGPK